MSGSTVEHFSHPEHLLKLKEDVVIEADATCSVCDQSVIGSPTYTCSSNKIGCESFYLHKSCAQLPTEIVRPTKDQHPLALQPKPSSRSSSPHTYTAEASFLFRCDACYEKTEDYSYVCLPCDFWIHKKCAASPPIIPAPTYHHHPLALIFSIPLEHRYFSRNCAICKELIGTISWTYYCHKCTFFVHLKCSTSTISFRDEIEENNDSDLIQFPLPGVESLFDFIITQCRRFQVEIQGDGENRATISTVNDEPRIILRHWSHADHPLELLQFTTPSVPVNCIRFFFTARHAF
nr:PREDICTED: uncharacterized protein LOC108207886 [Daucus carota subsp. sativus]